jgi:hypothetical protein
MSKAKINHYFIRINRVLNKKSQIYALNKFDALTILHAIYIPKYTVNEKIKKNNNT